MSDATELRVPSKDYGVQVEALAHELLPALEAALRNEEPVLGASVAAFERDFAAFCGCPYGVGVNSGTDALVLALRALGVGPGDEVVTAGNTFVATVAAIHAVGARPVLVDPDPDTLVLTAACVEPALGPRTRAVLAVHLYGRLAAIEELETLCARHELLLLEDAAQAHGARTADGRTAGGFGVAGCFSFHPSKNLGAFGDAGLVTTHDAALDARLRVLRNLGKAGKYEVHTLAPNSKLDTLQAVILGVRLRHLEAWNARRRDLAARYAEAFADLEPLELPPPAPHPEEHVHHLFVVHTDARDALREAARERGVRLGLHYPVPPHLQPLDLDLGYAPGSLPVSERSARRCLTLPCSWELTDAQQARVIEVVREFFGAGGQP